MHLDHRYLGIPLLNQIAGRNEYVLFERIGDDKTLDFPNELKHVSIEQVGVPPVLVAVQLVWFNSFTSTVQRSAN
ncbi:hypothetical protein AWB78_07823 [Caballeronia calidae]|uniref:Uncharacterized protein n=1 Tax=Caballeronia calidae TaxID=1777139 RepID=A0A158EGS5_9BURK|nr:hypothetical protein AWB78_07823 [Caballeronia calidae]